MSSDGASKPGNHLDEVRVKTDVVRTVTLSRRERYQGVFTERWKDFCREVLREYARVHPTAAPGKALGATRLRRLIMSGLEDANSATLSVDNIHDWLRGYKGHLDDVKFSYVDEFIRRVQLADPVYTAISSSIKDYKDSVLRKALRSIHSVRAIDAIVPEPRLSVILDKVFITKPLKHESVVVGVSPWNNSAKFSQIVLYIHDYREGVFAVTALYSFNSIWQMGDDKEVDPAEVVTYFGYLLPTGGSSPQKGKFIHGLLYLTRAGAEELHYLSHSTISRFQIHTAWESRFTVNWTPYLLHPLAQILSEDSPEHLPPDLGVRIEEDEASRDNFWVRFGEIGLEEMQGYENVSSFIKNLTNEYLVW